MSSRVSDPYFWNDLYLARSTGWDKGRVAPPIARLIDERVVPDGARVVVLGFGRGHDAIHAATRGLDVTAVDFAEEAVNATRSAARGAALELEVLEQDAFTLADSHPGSFDAVLEHTSFCSIDPQRRPEYARMVHTILRPGGTFLGLFFAHGRDGGPPFSTSEAEVRALFEPLFEIERLQVAPDSFPSRVGEELEFVFRRRDDA